MKLLATFLYLSIVSFAGAAPGLRSQVAGAAFFMTNEPSGNQLVVSAVGSDGKLTFSHAVDTLGNGSHGVSDPIGPDPLFAQDAVKVAGNFVFAVNPGSDTVSMFTINPRNPLDVRMAGSGPVSTEGQFPIAVSVNPNGKTACVVNGGQLNGVACFSMSATAGLTLLPNSVQSLGLNQTTPPNGPPGTVSDILHSEDGSQLLVSVKGVPPTPGFLAVFAVNEDGSLSDGFEKLTPGTGGLLPFSMTLIPGTSGVLATDAGIGFDTFDISANGLSAAASGTAQGDVVPIDGQGATCWSSFSQVSNSFFLTDIKTSIITRVSVDANLQGSVLQQFPLDPASSTIDNFIANVGGQEFLYVLSPGTQTVNVLSIPSNGNAKVIQNFAFADAAKQKGIITQTNNLQGMAVFVNA